MENTVSAIIEASEYPLSIVIVGVGNENFEMMEFLDSDGQLLRQGHRVAKRDIVQFVPFRKFASKPPSELAREVLAEIPAQLCQYMKLASIVPNKRQ